MGRAQPAALQLMLGRQASFVPRSCDRSAKRLDHVIRLRSGAHEPSCRAEGPTSFRTGYERACSLTTSGAVRAGVSCRGTAEVWSAGGAAAAREATAEQKASRAAVISSMMGTMSG